MKTFKVEIIESLSRIVEIEANTKDEAISIVNEKYKNEEIVLDYNDFKYAAIESLEDNIEIK
ncbi:MAG: DpnD protein [Bacteroidetes bacterium GWE2_29_8]|nr:MAG: DpnD protein [Bacteroidetes bacterium GWE2_29_8]OFY16751.1 MAG: DpnD protein [Bacteroidetes bacterium GWF2_29_10]